MIDFFATLRQENFLRREACLLQNKICTVSRSDLILTNKPHRKKVLVGHPFLHFIFPHPPTPRPKGGGMQRTKKNKKKVADKVLARTRIFVQAFHYLIMGLRPKPPR